MPRSAPRAQPDSTPTWPVALETIQKELFAVGARLADPAKRIAGRVTKAAVQESDVERLEQLIDRLESELEPLRRFILPGGALPGALLHMSRTICRRAERRVVASVRTPSSQS